MFSEFQELCCYFSPYINNYLLFCKLSPKYYRLYVALTSGFAYPLSCVSEKSLTAILPKLDENK